MQKWITTTDAQWQTALKHDVTDVREAERSKLKQQYGLLLEAATSKASGAGDLDAAVALRDEQKRFTESGVFPEQDGAAEAAAVKQARALIRIQLAKLETESAARTKALYDKYDQLLSQAQTQLTQRGRLDDALLVKAKREEVAGAWMTPKIKAATQTAEAAAPAGSPAAAAVQERGNKSDPIVGEWIWNSNMDITVNADGTVDQRSDGSAKWSAKWRLLESRTAERKYEFTWTKPDGSTISDALTLSSDGKSLEGKNQQNHRVGGKRVEH